MPEARTLRVESWQHSCPQCGYENGFHISFGRPAPRGAGKTADEEVAVWLICPSCSALFDVGLRTRLSPVPRA